MEQTCVPDYSPEQWGDLPLEEGGGRGRYEIPLNFNEHHRLDFRVFIRILWRQMLNSISLSQYLQCLLMKIMFNILFAHIENNNFYLYIGLQQM